MPIKMAIINMSAVNAMAFISPCVNRLALITLLEPVEEPPDDGGGRVGGGLGLSSSAN